MLRESENAAHVIVISGGGLPLLAPRISHALSVLLRKLETHSSPAGEIANPEVQPTPPVPAKLLPSHATAGVTDVPPVANCAAVNMIIPPLNPDGESVKPIEHHILP
jgi:hypothetical protein